VARWGPRRAPPFAARVFRYRAVGVDKPAELERAELLHMLLTTYPGYTLSTLLAEDAELLRLMALLDPDLGKAED